MAAPTVAAMDEFDPLDIQAQEQQRAANADADELARQQAESDFKWLMADPRGRRIIWRQLAAAGVFRHSFDPNAMTMAFNEGCRSQGLRLLDQVHKLCPDLYTTMMKEQTECPPKP